MKKELFFTVLAALTFLALQLNATVWRVNNTPGASAHYTTAQAAHDALTTLNGDTLYIEGSAINYGGLWCIKKLIIIGPGYFLNENPQTQANVNPAFFDGYIYFNAGSAGSKFMGCKMSSYLYVNDSNITVERNFFEYGALYQNSTNLTNIKVLRNYFYMGNPWSSSIYFASTCNNVIIAGNYIAGALTSNPGFYGFVVNNIFAGYVTLYNSTVTNNISTINSFTPYNCVVTYNIGNYTQFGTANGNQENVPTTNIFVDPTGNSTDGRWQLKPGSPAIGGGEGGADCGMYGGNYPYILSGIPAIPAVYFYNAPSMPTNVINVSIKAKTHN